jgi:hypothetical protein
VRAAKFGYLAGGLHVEDEVDVALTIVADILRSMVAEMGEAHRGEQAGKGFGIGAGEFDELKAIKAERIFVLGHGCAFKQ